MTVFVFEGCCYREPPTGGLSRVYCLTVLEDRSQGSRGHQGWCLQGTVGANLCHASLLASGGLLTIAGVPWHVSLGFLPSPLCGVFLYVGQCLSFLFF